MIARVREVDIANHTVHGGGRKPDAEFTVDPAALEAWTARNVATRASYRARLRWVAERDRREAAADRAEDRAAGL